MGAPDHLSPIWRAYRLGYTAAFRERLGGCLIGLRVAQRRARLEDTAASWDAVCAMVEHIKGEGSLNNWTPGVIGHRPVSRTLFRLLDATDLEAWDRWSAAWERENPSLVRRVA